MKNFLFSCFVTTCFVSSTFAQENNSAELKQFQGRWNVIELVENGRVLSAEQIKSELPSGGQAEIIENTIIFQSPKDGKKYAKTFSITPTQYPKTLSIFSQQVLDGYGVYKFDDGRLVICIAHPDAGDRPNDFSAAEGSNRMLMVLKKEETTTKPKEVASSTIPAAKPPSQPAGAGKVITDEQVTTLLRGTWKYNDSVGALYVTFDPSGTFHTVREVKERNVFHKVFVQTPISSGRWSVQNGKLRFTVLSSIHLEKVHREFDFTIRSISNTDFIFIDYMGHTGRSVRVR